VERSYREAEASETAYVVVRGRLEFDPALMPRTDLSGMPEGRELPARIEGKGLTEGGFDTPFRQDLTLEAQCLGAWCATAEPGAEVLAFIESGAEGYRLVLSPCGGMMFAEPSGEDLERVEACYQGSMCEDAG